MTCVITRFNPIRFMINTKAILDSDTRLKPPSILFYKDWISAKK